MTSNAMKKFEESLSDIESLLEVHELLEEMSEDSGQPMPHRFDVLFRSATVLLVSTWEAYVEDICAEGLEFLIEYSKDTKNIPKELKKQIAKELRNGNNEIEIWGLADDGWRTHLKSRLSKLKEGRDRNFNTPKSVQTSDFIKQVLGIENIQAAWKFSSYDYAEASKKLDHLVSVRGEIAHRGIMKDMLDKDWIIVNLAFIRALSSKTDDWLVESIKKLTDMDVWRQEFHQQI